MQLWILSLVFLFSPAPAYGRQNQLSCDEFWDAAAQRDWRSYLGPKATNASSLLDLLFYSGTSTLCSTGIVPKQECDFDVVPIVLVYFISTTVTAAVATIVEDIAITSDQTTVTSTRTSFSNHNSSLEFLASASVPASKRVSSGIYGPVQTVGFEPTGSFAKTLASLGRQPGALVAPSLALIVGSDFTLRAVIGCNDGHTLTTSCINRFVTFPPFPLPTDDPNYVYTNMHGRLHLTSAIDPYFQSYFPPLSLCTRIGDGFLVPKAAISSLTVTSSGSTSTVTGVGEDKSTPRIDNSPSQTLPSESTPPPEKSLGKSTLVSTAAIIHTEDSQTGSLNGPITSESTETETPIAPQVNTGPGTSQKDTDVVAPDGFKTHTSAPGEIQGDLTSAGHVSTVAVASNNLPSGAAIFTIGAQTYTADSVGLMVGSTIFAPGSVATIAGEVISIGSNEVIIGSRTLPFPTMSQAAVVTNTGFTLGGQLYTYIPSPVSTMVIGGTTLSIGGPAVTLSGLVVSLGPGGVVLSASGTNLVSAFATIASSSRSSLKSSEDMRSVETISVSGTMKHLPTTATTSSTSEAAPRVFSPGVPLAFIVAVCLLSYNS